MRIKSPKIPTEIEHEFWAILEIWTTFIAYNKIPFKLHAGQLLDFVQLAHLADPKSAAQRAQRIIKTK